MAIGGRGSRIDNNLASVIVLNALIFRSIGSKSEGLLAEYRVRKLLAPDLATAELDELDELENHWSDAWVKASAIVFGTERGSHGVK